MVNELRKRKAKKPITEFEAALAEATGKSKLMVRFYGYRLGIEIALRRVLTDKEQNRLALFIRREMGS